MTEPLRVAIVETLPEVHLAIAALLEGAPDVRLVGHARSLPELASEETEGIDVLVADLRACLRADVPALRTLRERCPGLRLIITTSNGGREYEEAIARLTPDGWVQKTHLAAQLLGAVRGTDR